MNYLCLSYVSAVMLVCKASQCLWWKVLTFVRDEGYVPCFVLCVSVFFRWFFLPAWGFLKLCQFCVVVLPKGVTKSWCMHCGLLVVLRREKMAPDLWSQVRFAYCNDYYSAFLWRPCQFKWLLLMCEWINRLLDSFFFFGLRLISGVDQPFDHNERRLQNVKFARRPCINYVKALRTQNISLNNLYAQDITFELFLKIYQQLTDI